MAAWRCGYPCPAARRPAPRRHRARPPGGPGGKMFARGHGKSSAGVAGPPGGGQRSAKICARPEGCRPVAGTPAAAQAGGAGTGSTPLPVRNRRGRDDQRLAWHRRWHGLAPVEGRMPQDFLAGDITSGAVSPSLKCRPPRDGRRDGGDRPWKCPECARTAGRPAIRPGLRPAGPSAAGRTAGGCGSAGARPARAGT